MIRASLILLLVPFAAQAQLSLFAVSGTTESPVAGTYQIGTVATGVSKTTRLRARNTGAAGVTVTNLAISGSGFSITQSPSPPFTIAPGNFQDIYVQFSGTLLASYSANLQIVYGGTSVSVLLLVTVVAAPSLATVSTGNGCTGPDPGANTIDFGRIQSGQTAACAIVLKNGGAQSLTVSAVSVSGVGFQLSNAVQTPIVLAPGGSANFTVNFAPTSATTYSGALTVNTQTYPLTGIAFSAPLPTPSLQFDAGIPASGQQRTLTMQLGSPSPIAASGSVLLSFRSASTVMSDDPAVVFVATGARSVPFSINAGDTQFKLGGQTGAVFQTGTTAGSISFSISSNATFAGSASASMTIPPAVVAVDNAAATSRAGDLDIQVWGFDNTYSAGQMSFTFYDTAGNMIHPGAVSADFTSQFHTYFAAGNGGSAFQMRVSFPVVGDSTQVGAVDVKLTNSAGAATLQRLTFNP
ncbi:MAG: choice-of-anchor D domain-containing protein [Bryobacterales bacterium]|nr:choice-of-anchor D domain-containing protein [Bryobacterales bacterium]MBV9397136.1 choice-of-anchor D domain-containing protein [Bryobacterales bacterium]